MSSFSRRKKFDKPLQESKLGRQSEGIETAIENCHISGEEPGNNNVNISETANQRGREQSSNVSHSNNLTTVTRFESTSLVSSSTGSEFRQVNSLHYQQRHQRNNNNRRNNNGNGFNRGFWCVRGFSANRGQQVYFNCVTTVPLVLHFNPSGINMDVPNGFGGSNHFHGQGNGSNQNHHQIRHSHHHQAQSGGYGAAQTVNNGTNIFNFYFVNSGQYDLSFSGLGLPGSEAPNTSATRAQPEQQFPSTTTNNANAPGTSTSMFSPGNPFPNTFGAAPPARGNGTFANYHSGVNPATSPAHFVGPVVLPQPQAASSVPYSAFRPIPSTSGINHQPFAPHSSSVNAHVSNPQFGPNYTRYRESDTSYYQSLSQGSLDNFDDMYDEQENYIRPGGSQCAFKGAPFGGHHCHFNGHH